MQQLGAEFDVVAKEEEHEAERKRTEETRCIAEHERRDITEQSRAQNRKVSHRNTVQEQCRIVRGRRKGDVELAGSTKSYDAATSAEPEALFKSKTRKALHGMIHPRTAV